MSSGSDGDKAKDSDREAFEAAILRGLQDGAYYIEWRGSPASPYRCETGDERRDHDRYLGVDWAAWCDCVAHYLPLIEAGRAAVEWDELDGDIQRNEADRWSEWNTRVRALKEAARRAREGR